VEALRCRPETPVDLAPGLSLSRAPEGLLRVNWRQPLVFGADRKPVSLRRRGRAKFSDVELTWTFRSQSGAKLAASRSGEEHFDADVVGAAITLRRWQPGDRFQPIGMATAVKLQDLFTNQKIPAARRRQLIVAETSAGVIFWVEGLRIGELAKLRPITRRRLCWRWRRWPKRSLQAPPWPC
jgi:tRNA(Ile)-lysidine synthase